MKTFLVPIDFSEISEEIADTAISFAQAFHGRVVLLHSIPPPILTSEYALPVEVAHEAVMAGEKSAEARLTEYADPFRRANLGIDVIVRHGGPVTAILEEAARVHADFIIMGSHGHGRLYDLLVGSTASGVLKGAQCGVIIMPPAERCA
jgi:nucleotide-binding universal stress UspA family protein